MTRKPRYNELSPGYVKTKRPQGKRTNKQAKKAKVISPDAKAAYRWRGWRTSQRQYDAGKER